MNYIKIEANSNGGHKNQFGGKLPDTDWAIIPASITIPSTFPCVNIEVEKDEETGLFVVTSMTEGVVPEPQPIIHTPTEIERLRADVDFIMAMEGYIE